MISTRNLTELPPIGKLKRISQSLAVLDAILCPDWSSRYYSFDTNWDSEHTLASMKTGSGDSYCILFSSSGAIIKGDAHETQFERFSVLNGKPWPGVLDAVPTDFNYFLHEPAFSVQEATFLVWRREADATWNVGKIDFPNTADPDGSADLLAILDGDPNKYKKWGEEYYDRSIPISCVEHIYEFRPLTNTVVAQLNPEISLEDLSTDLAEIGYMIS